MGKIEKDLDLVEDFETIRAISKEGKSVQVPKSKLGITEPDDEDITLVEIEKEKRLQFKDKLYSPDDYSGLGRTYLRKNMIDGVNILTQSFFINDDGSLKSNTRYIIQYDYDLNGSTISIPEGCLLDFQGGSFRNGTIIGSNTVINAKLYKIFDNIIINGTWDVDLVYPQWFGAKGDGVTNDSDSINKCFQFNRTIHLTNGTYLCNIDYSSRVTLEGEGENAVILQSYTPELPVINIDVKFGNWQMDLAVKNLKIKSTSAYNGVGVQIGSTEPLSGRVLFYKISFEYFDKCIFKSSGNIGNVIQYCEFNWSNYHYYAVSSTLSMPMHAGCDLIIKNHFKSAQKASVYISSLQDGSGQTLFRDNIFESNPGFVFFIDGYRDDNFFPSLLFDSNWLENNYTSNTVNINNTDYTPSSFFLRNVKFSSIHNMNITKVVLEGSVVYAKNCSQDDDKYDVEQDEYSSLVLDGINTFKSLYGAIKTDYILGVTKSAVFKTPHKVNEIVLNQANEISVLDNTSFNDFTYLSGTSQLTPRLINDGILYGKCCEYTIPTSGMYFSKLFNTSTYNYFVYTFCVKLISGTGLQLRPQYDGNFNTIIDITSKDWITYTGFYSNVDHALDNTKIAISFKSPKEESVVRCSCFQVLAFNKLQDALDFANSSYFINNKKLTSNKGTTNERPVLTWVDEGFEYYDSTLKRKILWEGHLWVNIDGSKIVQETE